MAMKGPGPSLLAIALPTNQAGYCTPNLSDPSDSRRHCLK
jgi:hypothetical protein